MTHDRTDADGGRHEPAGEPVDPVAADGERTDRKAGRRILVDKAERRPGPSRTAVFVAGGVAVVALIAAVVFGILWWTTMSSTEYEAAQTRQAVLDTARRAVVAYSAFDHANPDKARQAQRAMSTDEFNAATEAGWPNARKLIVKEKLDTSVQILDIGIARLEPSTAEVVAAVHASKIKDGKTLGTIPLRLVTQLRLVGDEWKVDNFAPAPSIASSGSE